MIRDIILYTLLAAIFCYLVYRFADYSIMKPYYFQRKSLFELLQVKQDSIVFAGDSITDGGEWEELLPGLPVVNRGINADKVKGLWQRMDCIVDGHPAKVFILIGVNDLPFPVFHNDQHIMEYYQKILEILKQRSPETQVYVQSIFPTRKPLAKRVIRINQQLKALAETMGVTYIDIYSKLAAEDGTLRDEYTNDKLHLLARGYQVWLSVIRPYLS